RSCDRPPEQIDRASPLERRRRREGRTNAFPPSFSFKGERERPHPQRPPSQAGGREQGATMSVHPAKIAANMPKRVTTAPGNGILKASKQQPATPRKLWH